MGAGLQVSSVLKHLSTEEAAHVLDKAEEQLRGAILSAIPPEDAAAIIGGIMFHMDETKLHEALTGGTAELRAQLFMQVI